MHNWYQTKEGSNLQHGGLTIKAKQKILLSKEQAQLHGDQVEPVDPPKDASDVAVLEDWEIYSTQTSQKKK